MEPRLQSIGFFFGLFGIISYNIPQNSAEQGSPEVLNALKHHPQSSSLQAGICRRR